MQPADFSPRPEAIRKKGFSVVHYHQNRALAQEFTAGLAKSNQVWIIASCDDSGAPRSKAHQRAVKASSTRAHGVYLWATMTL